MFESLLHQGSHRHIKDLLVTSIVGKHNNQTEKKKKKPTIVYMKSDEQHPSYSKREQGKEYGILSVSTYLMCSLWYLSERFS